MLLLCIFLSLYGTALCSEVEVVIGTWTGGFRTAVEAGCAELSRGGSSLDAVEAACQTCEEIQCEYTVGYGGSPDEHGETTLDAFIMDGTTMNIGAVAALRRVKNAIGVARRVLDNTRHSMLAGDQATHFAITMGFKEEPLSTNASKQKWKKWRLEKCQPNFWTNVKPDPKTSCGPYKPVNFSDRLPIESNPDIGRYNHDTIGVVVLDSKQDIAAGTSTNGANHKIPGRVGDSPIPGAGAYADSAVGGAAATGDGDVMMRFLPSFLVVELMRSGLSVDQAVQTAIQRIAKFYPDFTGAVIGLDKKGRGAAACYGMPDFPYVIGYRKDEPTFSVTERRVTCIRPDPR